MSAFSPEAPKATPVPTTELNVESDLSSPFEIKLKAPMASGYQWEPEFDSSKLRLELHSRQIPRGNRIGGSTFEIFKFTPLEKGNYSLVFSLKRNWENSPAQKRRYTIQVL